MPTCGKRLANIIKKFDKVDKVNEIDVFDSRNCRSLVNVELMFAEFDQDVARKIRTTIAFTLNAVQFSRESPAVPELPTNNTLQAVELPRGACAKMKQRREVLEKSTVPDARGGRKKRG